MAEKSKSSVDNYSKGQGGAFKSGQGQMGANTQAQNDSEARKQTGITNSAFKETMNSRNPTQS